MSPALFEMLGVAAAAWPHAASRGRAPDAEAAVISAAAWQQFFGSDPSVLGRRITLNNTSFTIVGVMPPGFDYPEARHDVLDRARRRVPDLAPMRLATRSRQ